MKRVVLMIAVAVLGWGCTAQRDADVVYQDVELRVSGVRSGEIATRSVADVLDATAPSGIPTLRLESVDVSTRVYSVSPGESVSVPVGRYRVSGNYTGEKVGTANGNGLYQEPSYAVSGEIDVVPGVSQYTVSAAYDCAAILVSEESVSRVTHYYEGASDYVDLAVFKHVGGYGVLYMRLAYNINWYVRVYPQDVVNQESRLFNLVSGKVQSGTVFVERGRWYLLSPSDVERQEGDIVIDLPDWSEGAV